VPVQNDEPAIERRGNRKREKEESDKKRKESRKREVLAERREN
jgi:hypothetical protein